MGDRVKSRGLKEHIFFLANSEQEHMLPSTLGTGQFPLASFRPDSLSEARAMPARARKTKRKVKSMQHTTHIPTKLRVARQPHIRDLHGRTPKSRRRIRLLLELFPHEVVGQRAVNAARVIATNRGYTPAKPRTTKAIRAVPSTPVPLNSL